MAAQTKKKSKRTASKKTARKATRPAKPSAPVSPRINAASVSELEAEIKRRKRGAATLVSKRERLAAQMAEIDAELAGMGLAPDGSELNGTGTRYRNDKTLPDAIAEVLDGVEMRVGEIAQAVQASGYRTTASNFTTIVSQALGREKRRFKKVSRGIYTAK